MKTEKRIICFLPVLILLLVSCSDSRPDAAGAAHIYNSTEDVVTVLVKPKDADGASFLIPPEQGKFVPLRKADTYTVSVTKPAAHSSYTERIVVKANDKTDTVFGIGSTASFELVPTFHVPKDIPEQSARAEVERLKKLDKHQEFYFEEPAPKHILPRGVYYSFGDDVEAVSRSSISGKKIEVRYKLAAFEN